MRKTIFASMFLATSLMGNAYATDTEDLCPKVSDIKSSPYRDGFKYEATDKSGQSWSEALSTEDDVLDPKYKLAAFDYDDDICYYTSVGIENDVKSQSLMLRLNKQ